MKLVKYLIIPFVLLLSITAHADEKITTAKVKELATTDREPRQHTTYLSKDGKVRYSVYDVHLDDGTVEMRTKKSYLPAVTDGINRDKTSKFRIPPNAKKMAKYFAKGANHAIFLSMIIDVLGDGVDYVLDEKNNSIQYTDNESKYTCQVPGYNGTPFNTAKSYCNNYKGGYVSHSIFQNHSVATLKAVCKRETVNIHCTANSTETKVMNDEEFAQAVIELAKADNAKAKKVMIDVAKQAVSDGDYDKEIQKAVDELNADETKDDTQDNQNNTSDSSNASSSDSTNTDSQDDTQATPKNQNDTDNNGGNDKDKFELPAFCDWAKHVCDFIDWFKKEPELPESPSPQIPIDDKGGLANADINKKLYDVGGECPPPKVIALPLGNIEIPYDSLCLFFSKNSPFVIAIAYIIGAYIVMGRG